MTVFDAIDATWPAAETRPCGPFLLRLGKGGGKRVSCATASGPVTEAALDAVLAEFARVAQEPLFMLRAGEVELDSLLDARGFAVVDPVVVLDAPITTVMGPGPDPVTAFPAWPPLARQVEIWSDAGIGAARLAVMDRVEGPRITILGRSKDSPAGTAFAACAGDWVMVHALEVRTAHRRTGCARNMLRAAAQWGHAQGAQRLATLTLRENLPARALFSSLGLQPVGHYHYRMLPHEQDMS